MLCMSKAHTADWPTVPGACRPVQTLLSFFKPKAPPAEPPQKVGKRGAADAAADVAPADTPLAQSPSPGTAKRPRLDAHPASATAPVPRASPGLEEKQEGKRAGETPAWARPGGCAVLLTAKTGAGPASRGAADGAGASGGAGCSCGEGAGLAKRPNGEDGGSAGGSSGRRVAMKREQVSVDLATDWDRDVGAPGRSECNGAGGRGPPREESGAPMGREGAMRTLLAMGFSELQAGRALAHAQGDVSRAAEWICQNCR